MATNSKSKSKWTIYHSLSLLAILVAIILVGLSPTPQNPNRVIPWLITLVLMATSSVVISSGITGSWRGLLIDDRNKISLSRTQMFLWIVLVVSAVLTAGISNSRIDPSTSPMSFSIPSELWLLMGISTTSLVASPLIRNTKTDQKPDQKQIDKTVTQMQKQSGKDPNIDIQGVIVVNQDPQDASFADMFKGEEAGNAAQLDLSKMQMFYFTIGTVVAYGTAIAALFSTTSTFAAFPAISQGMVALLGISHAGYLTGKAIRHTDPADDLDASQLAPDGGQIETDTARVTVRSTQSLQPVQNTPTAPAASTTAIDPNELANAKG